MFGFGWVVYLVVCWGWCSLVWVMLRGFVLCVIVGCMFWWWVWVILFVVLVSGLV